MLVATDARAVKTKTIAAAFLLVAPTLVVLLPAALVLSTPTAEAQQSLIGPDYRIVNWTVGVQSKQTKTFLSSDNPVKVWVKVDNRGLDHPSATNPVQNVPLLVYARAKVQDADGNFVYEYPESYPETARSCRMINIEGGEAAQEFVLNLNVPAPAEDAPSDLVQYDVRIFVNRWPADEPSGFPTGNGVFVPSQEACKEQNVIEENGLASEPGNPSQTYPASEDNFESHIVIVDRLLNLEPTRLLVCRTDGVQPMCPPGPDYLRTSYTARSDTEDDGALNVSVMVGNVNGTYLSRTNPNTGDPWEFDIRVVATHVNSSREYVLIDRDAQFDAASGTGWTNVTTDTTEGDVYFQLWKKAGDYVFTATIDPNGDYTEASKADNDLSRAVNVRGADLTGSFYASLLPTTPADAIQYEVQPNTHKRAATVNVKFDVLNAGDLAAANDTSSPPSDSFTTRVYLDEVTDHEDHKLYTFGLTTLAAQANATRSFTFRGYNPATTTDPETDWVPLTPGEHTLILLIDCEDAGDEECAHPDETIFERNESNNRQEIKFYVEDSSKPIVQNFSLVRRDYADFETQTDASGSGSIDLTINRTEQASWRVKVTDDDTNVNVTLKVQDSEGNVTEHRMDKWTNGTRWTYVWNLTHARVGTFTAWVVATDSATNTAESKKFKLKVQPWEIQRLDESTILKKDLPNGNETIFEYGTSGFIFTIHVNASSTGLTPTSRTDNKVLHVWYPPGDREDTPTVVPSSLNDPCEEEGEIINIPPPPGQGGSVCTPYEFTLRVGTTQVGKYNISILVTDKAGDVRYINRSFEVKGEIPEFLNTTTFPASVQAGHTFKNVTAEVADEFGVEAVHLIFKRTDGSYVKNLSMTRLNGTAERGNWTINVTTGFDKMVDHGGQFNVTYSAKNVNDAWNRSEFVTTIQDGKSPEFIGTPGATPSPQEITLPVEFYARAQDATNFSVKVVVKKGNNEVYHRGTLLREGTSNNYTYSYAFPEAGDYTYTIEAVDSVANPVTVYNGVLPIRTNLPPRFAMQLPSYVNAAGERFSDERPTIQVLVSDINGVQQDTINVSAHTFTSLGDRVNITLAETSTAASQSPPGFIATYTLASTTPLSHNTTVYLQMSAVDLSTETLTGYHNTTFRVDAEAPTSSMSPTFSGSQWFRSEDEPLVISPDTKFSLTAEDHSASATAGVKSLQFTVTTLIGTTEATSSTFTFERGSTLTLRELFQPPFNVQNAGSGIYRLTYWATDNVSNVESPKRTYEVYLDATAPYPDALTRPQGQFVSVKWYDDDSEVRSAHAWYNVNGGVHSPLPLVRAGDQWTATIPDGTKGDEVCYYLTAHDAVDNRANLGNATAPFACYDVGNQVPGIQILEPGDGARVSGVVNLRWLASDPDGEPLTFKVYYRLSGTQNAREVASLTDGTSRYALDTTAIPDGRYEIQVTVTDGTFVGFDAINLTISNSEQAIESPSVDKKEVRPGETVLVTAVVTKAGASVEAHVYRGGNFVESFPMNDDGENGDAIAGDKVYTAAVTFQEGGEYSVKILANYEEDGETKTDEVESDAAFTVKLTAADVFSQFAPLWVTLVALVVACLGVAGYALLRKWRV